jgi:DNA-binding IclR family transcriptional regulator
MSIIAVERALILLRYILDKPEGMSIREASRELGYSPATVQKLVAALAAQGFAVQDHRTERYQIGAEAIQLGLAALARTEIRQISRRHLENLSSKTHETVFLAIARTHHAIYIDKVVSDQPIRMDAPLGINRPFNCTAVGKVLLADKSAEEIERLAREGAFVPSTRRSIVERDKLMAELDQVRLQAWAQDNEEFISGAGCVAAPVYNHDARVIAAIAVSGPAERIHARLEELVTEVKETAAGISQAMGYRKSP